ncbi:MAG: glycosyltransferase [Chitinophagaceae bacterium]|nr:MAG: glycosyltransferase [Chitinophagaceae bacterium]
MWYWFGVVVMALYLLCSLWFFVCSVLQLHLLWKSRTIKQKSQSFNNEEQFPIVSIQVPVFNERYVIARLLESLGHLDYPKDRFEIQVLDDSTDDTSDIIRTSCENLSDKGIMVTILHRTDRKGYKAGALEEGLPSCQGAFIAIFDADFTPAPNFLKEMLGYFKDPKVGGVQGRWQHRNLHENWLTVIQSYLLDSHFSLEQKGRSAAGYFLNFNGTAGMWRKQCIVESGGWNGQVLTEDLELSYRAQLLGWKFLYNDAVAVPSDLPADVDAFKAQQFRWAKGMAQSSLCHLRAVLKMRISYGKKIHAMAHLLGSVSFLAVLGNILLALPLVIARHYSGTFSGQSELIVLTGITLPVICLYYSAGTKSNLSRRDFWLHLPVFLVVYMALSAQNSLAVVQAWLGHKTPFVRTPKPESINKGYTNNTSAWSGTMVVEIIVLLYLLGTTIVCIVWEDYLLLSFLLMALAGSVMLLRPALTKVFRNSALGEAAIPVNN